MGPTVVWDDDDTSRSNWGFCDIAKLVLNVIFLVVGELLMALVDEEEEQ